MTHSYHSYSHELILVDHFWCTYWMQYSSWLSQTSLWRVLVESSMEFGFPLMDTSFSEFNHFWNILLLTPAYLEDVHSLSTCLYVNSSVERYLPFTHFSRTLSFVLLYPFTELWTYLFGKSAKMTWVFIASISSVILDESLYLWLFCYLGIELESSLVYLGLHCFYLICHPRWIPVCLIVLLSRHRIGVFSCIPFIWCLRCIPCIQCIRCFHSTAPRSRTCVL